VRPNGESAAGPASLDHLPQAPRLGAIALRLTSGSRLKSGPRGQLDYPRYSLPGPNTNKEGSSAEGLSTAPQASERFRVKAGARGDAAVSGWTRANARTALGTGPLGTSGLPTSPAARKSGSAQAVLQWS
jgi:hypothetical protein